MTTKPSVFIDGESTMRYAHLAPHVARDAVRLLDRGNPRAIPSTATTSAGSGEEMAKNAA